MTELGSMTDRFSESGQKVVRRAIELSKQRGHNSLTIEHHRQKITSADLFVSLFTNPNGTPVSIMRGLGADLDKFHEAATMLSAQHMDT